MKVKACNVQTNISSVIGNVTSFYINWLKTRFPTGFFKDTYISGTLNSLEMEKKDIIKRSKPTLMVRPEYGGENGYMELLPYWHNTQNYTFNNPSQYYNGVLGDSENKVYLYGIPDRIKIVMNTKILVPTKIYGINVLHYMKNIIEPGGHAFINDAFFENEIPKPFIFVILNKLSEIHGRKLDINVPEDRMILEDYLQSHSYNGIVERRNLSTGRFEYAFKHKTNILMNMDDIPSLETSRRGKAEDVAIVNFQVSFEFNTNSNFLFEAEDTIKTEIPPIEDMFDPKDNTYTFNITIPYDPVPETDGPFKLRHNKKFMCEANVAIDTLPFGDILDKRTNDMIDDNLEGLSLKKKVCDAKLYMGKLILPDTEYDVDWKNRVITIHQPVNNANYLFAFYINQLEFNKKSTTDEAYKQIKIKPKNNKKNKEFF